MKLSNFLTVKAAVATFFGIVFVLAPAALMSIYGTDLDSAGAFVAQMSGASLIGIGLICWFSKNLDWQALAGITLALFIADGIGFVVLLMGQLSGLSNILGWVNVAVYLLLTLGLGYFRFMKPPV